MDTNYNPHLVINECRVGLTELYSVQKGHGRNESLKIPNLHSEAVISLK